MGPHNQTSVVEFVFLGFSRDQGTNLLLFAVVLFMYLITLVGNTLIIMIICTDPQLSTPMYFFLSNLSFLDICYTTSVVPQLLVHFLISCKAISFNRCMAQLYISFSFGSTEFILLAAMAYDRYVAVCHPLHYRVLMNRRLCMQLASASWTYGFLNALVHTMFAMRLHFCSVNAINHFACEVLAVIKVACSETFVNEILLMVAGVFALLMPCIVVMVSYLYIIGAILHIRSSDGWQKAFSTCTSHLTVVILCYGSAIFAYMSPKTNTSPNQQKMLAFFYAVVTPMLNPIIYSLRNKEVKGALAKTRGKCNLSERY